jgi:hypothetical protein
MVLSSLNLNLVIAVNWRRNVYVDLLHVYSPRIQYPLVILASLLLLASQIVLICEERAQPPYLPDME